MSASFCDLYKFWFVEQRTQGLIDFDLTLFLVELCCRTIGFIMTLPYVHIVPSSYSAHLPSCLLPVPLWSSFPKQLPSVSIVFKLHSLAGSMRYRAEKQNKTEVLVHTVKTDCCAKWLAVPPLGTVDMLTVML